MGYEEDVDRVFVIVRETVAIVESAGGAGLEHVQSVGAVVAAGRHHMFEDAGSDTAALECRLRDSTRLSRVTDLVVASQVVPRRRCHHRG